MPNLSPNQLNILGTFLLATDSERYDGRQWYHRANNIARSCSQTSDIPFLACVGAMAALSPNNKWERNVRDAQNLISLFSIGGREAAEKLPVCTYNSNKEKALQILETIKHPYTIHPTNDGFVSYGVGDDGKEYTFDHVGAYAGLSEVLSILKGPKVCEFARCILAAEWNARSEAEWANVCNAVCIDGHAWCVWFGERRATRAVPTITPKVRVRIISDYICVSSYLTNIEKERFSPSQVQAVTWLAYRRLHGIK